MRSRGPLRVNWSLSEAGLFVNILFFQKREIQYIVVIGVLRCDRFDFSPLIQESQGDTLNQETPGIKSVDIKKQIGYKKGNTGGGLQNGCRATESIFWLRVLLRFSDRVCPPPPDHLRLGEKRPRADPTGCPWPLRLKAMGQTHGLFFVVEER